MTTEQAVRRLTDELEIRNVLAKIAIYTDLGNLDEYTSMFTEDVYWEVLPDGTNGKTVPPANGRDELVSKMKYNYDNAIRGPGTFSYHLLGNTTVDIDGDEALAISYIVLLDDANKKTETTIFKIYRDHFVRTSGGWKISKRYLAPA